MINQVKRKIIYHLCCLACYSSVFPIYAEDIETQKTGSGSFSSWYCYSRIGADWKCHRDGSSTEIERLDEVYIEQPVDQKEDQDKQKSQESPWQCSASPTGDWKCQSVSDDSFDESLEEVQKQHDSAKSNNEHQLASKKELDKQSAYSHKTDDQLTDVKVRNFVYDAPESIKSQIENKTQKPLTPSETKQSLQDTITLLKEEINVLTEVIHNLNHHDNEDNKTHASTQPHKKQTKNSEKKSNAQVELEKKVALLQKEMAVIIEAMHHHNNDDSKILTDNDLNAVNKDHQENIQATQHNSVENNQEIQDKVSHTTSHKAVAPGNSEHVSSSQDVAQLLVSKQMNQKRPPALKRSQDNMIEKALEAYENKQSVIKHSYTQEEPNNYMEHSIQLNNEPIESMHSIDEAPKSVNPLKLSTNQAPLSPHKELQPQAHQMDKYTAHPVSSYQAHKYSEEDYRQETFNKNLPRYDDRSQQTQQYNDAWQERSMAQDQHAWQERRRAQDQHAWQERRRAQDQHAWQERRRAQDQHAWQERRRVQDQHAWQERRRAQDQHAWQERRMAQDQHAWQEKRMPQNRHALKDNSRMPRDHHVWQKRRMQHDTDSWNDQRNYHDKYLEEDYNSYQVQSPSHDRRFSAERDNFQDAPRQGRDSHFYQEEESYSPTQNRFSNNSVPIMSKKEILQKLRAKNKDVDIPGRDRYQEKYNTSSSEGYRKSTDTHKQYYSDNTSEQYNHNQNRESEYHEKNDMALSSSDRLQEKASLFDQRYQKMYPDQKKEFVKDTSNNSALYSDHEKKTVHKQKEVLEEKTEIMDEYFVVQWGVSFVKADLEMLQDRYPQLKDGKIVSSEKDGKKQYTLSYGHYESKELAMMSLQEKKWKYLAKILNPWVKKLSTDTKEGKQQNGILSGSSQGHYTVQWAKSFDLNDILKLKTAYALFKNAEIVKINRSKYVEYLLIEGDYSDRLTALDSLSHPNRSSLSEVLKPQARPVASLYDAERVKG